MPLRFEWALRRRNSGAQTTSHARCGAQGETSSFLHSLHPVSFGEDRDGVL